MSNIIKDENNAYSELQSKDCIKIVINNEQFLNNIEGLRTYLEELSESESLFKYNEVSELNESGNVEVSIKVIFDAEYINMIYVDLENEIKSNSLKIEKLKQHNPLSHVSQILFDNKIDDLTDRNEELIKKQKIIKMQLFNSINQRNVIISKVTDYVNSAMPNSTVTYIGASTDMEKMFKDIESIETSVKQI